MWRALGLAVVASCSFVFTGSPGAHAPTELPVCTSSRASVIGDAIAAVPALVVAGFAADTARSPDGARVAVELGAPALVVGVAFVAAAIYGVHATSACQDAIDDALLALVREADAGNCEHVIAFAKTLVDKEPAMLRAVLANASFERCFSPAGE